MSVVATYWSYIASIIHDIMRPSVDTVGDDKYPLDIQPHCFLPSGISGVSEAKKL